VTVIRDFFPSEIVVVLVIVPERIVWVVVEIVPTRTGYPAGTVGAPIMAKRALARRAATTNESSAHIAIKDT
jgi:hypothetical protein